MPNIMKYEDVDWPEDGSPAAKGRLATAGEYTGQHVGKPMQDAQDEADNEPYLRARETVRCGTLTQDAGDTNLPSGSARVSYTAASASKGIPLSSAAPEVDGE